jgi:hypothetical protein
LKISKKSSDDFLIAFDNVKEMPKYFILPGQISSKRKGKGDLTYFVINLFSIE